MWAHHVAACGTALGLLGFILQSIIGLFAVDGVYKKFGTVVMFNWTVYNHGSFYTSAGDWSVNLILLTLYS